MHAASRAKVAGPPQASRQGSGASPPVPLATQGSQYASNNPVYRASQMSTQNAAHIMLPICACMAGFAMASSICLILAAICGA